MIDITRWTKKCNAFLHVNFSNFRPEVKEGKEGETEKTAEQENNESDKIEKELEKDKVNNWKQKFVESTTFSLNKFAFFFLQTDEKEKEKTEENKEKEEAK